MCTHITSLTIHIYIQSEYSTNPNYMTLLILSFASDCFSLYSSSSLLGCWLFLVSSLLTLLICFLWFEDTSHGYASPLLLLICWIHLGSLFGAYPMQACIARHPSVIWFSSLSLSLSHIILWWLWFLYCASVHDG